MAAFPVVSRSAELERLIGSCLSSPYSRKLETGSRPSIWRVLGISLHHRLSATRVESQPAPPSGQDAQPHRGANVNGHTDTDTDTDTETGNPEPPVMGDEAATLLGFLDRQRATFAWKVGGLDERGLRARLGPSSMTLGGMLKHPARFEDDTSTEWLHGSAQRAAGQSPVPSRDRTAEPALHTPQHDRGVCAP